LTAAVVIKIGTLNLEWSRALALMHGEPGLKIVCRSFADQLQGTLAVPGSIASHRSTL
tara:strand:- start:432 stop:605 length:174 start_codon:yes stop_codon:yes gene_type:complete